LSRNGCKRTGQIRKAELDRSEDKVALLKKWEKELLREMNAVRCRIEELEREK
jgi:hypothetical protein